ncbi:MAG: glycosyltransferase family 2 protein [Saprospiraceae bacterium]
MIDGISKFAHSAVKNYKFTVLIPTWNNLEFFRLCVKSIRENSQCDIQILAIINEGKDGTLEWVRQQKDIDFVHSKTNIGICYGLNSARSLIKADYVVYSNDDMYLLPGWDLELSKEIDSLSTKAFMLSCTMIEPTHTGNPCVVVKDFGRDLESFDEQKLLLEYSALTRPDWSGSTWPPNVVHIDMWDLVGGLSIEFSPGMYSDPDLSMKLYQAGVKIFKGKGSSMVYHFGSRSTKRIKKVNKGRKTFLLKWGITANVFTKQYLKWGQEYAPMPKEIELSSSDKWINKIKRIISC